MSRNRIIAMSHSTMLQSTVRGTTKWMVSCSVSSLTPLSSPRLMLTCPGFVQPFGPSDSPSSRGSPLTRGRGRGGRGGLGANATTASPRVESGSSTPVRGIGHRSRGGGLGSDRPSSGYKGKSTVGREGVTWGGRGAPIFVKSGELFKNGEVDIIRKDQGESCRRSGVMCGC